MNKSMRAAVVLLTVLVLPMSAVAEHSASADTNGLHYYFATARNTYNFGEVIPIDYVVTNVSLGPRRTQSHGSSVDAVAARPRYTRIGPSSPGRPTAGISTGTPSASRGQGRTRLTAGFTRGGTTCP